MLSGETHLFPAARAIELGLPPVGFRFRPTEELAMAEHISGGAVMRGEERGPGDRLVGTIEIGLFAASLVIDRFGVLADLTREAAAKIIGVSARARLLGEGEMELAGGTSGYRLDVLLQLDEQGLLRPECPYASWLALASDDAVVPGGLLVTVRSAGPIWRAATGLLNSLEVVGTSRPPAQATGPSARAPRLDLPVVRRR